MREKPPFPYFTETEVRPLSTAEREVLARMVQGLSVSYQTQAKRLMVVGRCGCGKCPTVFFEPHVAGDREHELVSYQGSDAFGGVVGALLLEKDGRLSQLEFFSADGHEPWAIPFADTLNQY